ncbi:MAG TPA: acetyl-CoA hydrolase/transferase C-terminal domain-containing protein [Thermomicrobiaceae bacterium]|nr:acetyl-CoA hydrolase/transferase C-terminal domain-containing protein [Thermomicrobiaceae bacterium]
MLPRLVISDGVGVPRSAPAALLAGHATVVGWMPVPPAWTAGLDQALALMGGAGARGLVQAGRMRCLPIRYSALPRALAGSLRPSVAVVGARPDGRGFRFGLEAGYGSLAARFAERVVIEVDHSLPVVADAPLVEARDFEVVEATEPAPDFIAASVDPIDEAIGAQMAAHVPAGATVQYGPGAIGDSAIRALAVAVHVHSGLITDAVADLAERGLLLDPATTAYLFGGKPLRELAGAGLVRLRGVEDTHSAARLAGLERFVSLNTALSVGLDGAVNVERVRGEQVGGIGGHPDFCAAASASPGGLSIIGLRSSRAGRSNIVPEATPVTTPRSDVDLVVTEQGVADLRGLDDRGRAAALIAVADPAFREELEMKVSTHA